MKQQGFAHPLLLLAGIGLLVFLAIGALAPFKDQLLTQLYPKPPSHAANSDPQLFDSPWPVYGQNLKRNQLSPYTGPQTLTNPKWTFNNGLGNFGGVTIGPNNTLYLSAGEEGMIAVDKNTGSKKWQFDTQGAGAEGHVEYPPTIDKNGMLYIGTESGEFYAIDSNAAVTGGTVDYKWKFAIAGAHMQVAPSIASDGTIHYLTDNGKLVALDPNGTVTGTDRVMPAKWVYPDIISSYGSARRNHVLYDSAGNLYFGVVKTVYSLTPSGQLRWKQTLPTDTLYDSTIIKGPAMSHDGSTLYFTSGAKVIAVGNLQDTSAATNHVLWSTLLRTGFIDHKALDRMPSVDKNGVVYIGTNTGTLFALNPDGTIKWNKTLPVSGTSVTHDGIRSEVLIDQAGTIYTMAGTTSVQKLYAIDSNTQAIKWEYQGGGNTGYPALGHAIDSNGTLYAIIAASTLAAFGGGAVQTTPPITPPPSQAPSPSPSAAPSVPPPSFPPGQGGGINGGTFFQGSGVHVESVYAKDAPNVINKTKPGIRSLEDYDRWIRSAKAANMNMLRFEVNFGIVSWDGLDQSVWDWSNSDKFLDGLVQNNIEPLALLVYGSRHLPDVRYTITAADMDKFIKGYADYCEATARRYGNRVKYYEIWNEPSFSLFWKWGETNFARTFAECAYRIKQVDADAKTLFDNNGLQFFTVPNSFTTRIVDTDVKLFANGQTVKVIDLVDILAAHHYPQYSNSLPENYNGATIAQHFINMDNFLKGKYGNPRGAKGFMMTEAGYPARDTNVTSPWVTERKQAALISRFALLLASVPRMDAFTQYELVDGPSATDMEHRYGITRLTLDATGNLTPKPAHTALKVLNGTLSDTSYTGEQTIPPLGSFSALRSFLYKFNGNGKYVVAAWLAVNGAPLGDISPSTSATKLIVSTPTVLLQKLDGTTQTLTRGTDGTVTVALTETPILVVSTSPIEFTGTTASPPPSTPPASPSPSPSLVPSPSPSKAPSPSPSPSKLPSPSPSSAPSASPAASSGGTPAGAAMPPPNISLNVNCINQGFSGNALTLSWVNPTNVVRAIHVSTLANFSSPRWTKNITPGAISTTLPEGFSAFTGATGPLTINPNTTYYVRVWNYTDGQAGTFSIPSCSAASVSPSKPGDTDNNGKVDIFDYNAVLGSFGQIGLNLSADIDKNGKVDIFDLNIVLSNFGK